MKLNINGDILCYLLAALFIGLKLTGYVLWSWTWVLAPLWIPVIIFLVLSIIVIANDRDYYYALKNLEDEEDDEE